MIPRQYNSPGVELNEIDKSQYDVQDASVVNTTTLVAGFADKGDDYDTKWILSLRDFVETYGYPTNEAERYFYNAAKTVFTQGGRLYTTKLPYDNNSRNKFSYTAYHVEIDKLSTVQDLGISELNNLDPQIQYVCQIKSKFDKETDDGKGHNLSSYFFEDEGGMLTIENLDDLLTKTMKPNLGDIIIVDTTRRRYGRNPNLEALHEDKKIYQYLGIVPVLTTAANALYYQYLLNKGIDNISAYSAIGKDAFKTLPNNYGIGYMPDSNEVKSELSTFSFPLAIEEKYRNSETINKTAVNLFPTIGYANKNNFEKDYLKHIGVVVFKMMLNPSDNNKIDFIPVESFTGSLNQKAKNPVTNENIFIDNIINKRSQYINFFSNVPFSLFDIPRAFKYGHDENIDENNADVASITKNITITPTTGAQALTQESSLGDTKSTVNTIKDDLTRSITKSISITKQELETVLNGGSIGTNVPDDFKNTDFKANAAEKCDIFYIGNQTITSLGFYMEDCKKDISINTSILEPLDIAIKNLEDPNRFRIDVVLDAGVSNIAQYVYTIVDAMLSSTYSEYTYDVPIEYDPTSTIYSTLMNSVDSSNTNVWRQVLNKFDNFTKNIRKDCIFVADGPRHLCINGDQKIIRKTRPTNTIKDNILPGIRYMTAFNSSYSCGYCDWFYTYDDTAREYFWCPPSIKAGGQFLYTDRMYAPWEAPAGIRRGRVEDAYDVAFTPHPSESEVIYNARWNYALSYPLDGIVLDGQKTWQKEKTALDRINVRRLMLMIEKDVREIGKYFKYEGITPAQINRFRDALIEYLNNIKNRNGIKEFAVVCDETNNTIQTIENNEMRATIGVIPVKTAEWIIINAICANQSANIEELTQTYAV